MGGATGIDWGSVLQIAKTLGIDVTPAMMNALHQLEMYELERMDKKTKDGK